MGPAGTTKENKMKPTDLFAVAAQLLEDDPGRAPQVADMLEQAGFPGIAARVRREWIEN